ncbi:hypothetical protein ASE30_22325 [Achromobacter sp. Root83]|uniref:hypothetical protein n=1 Tax=Achromobacter sp. Root83 TaxID=1736602 RepID=UPI00070BAAFB|nr:hypothetical protein [Achromobacter sp. Root83]KRC84564.1 hypothetical protein ASE30_22325 [Achromobacter sp. Root83]
MRQTPALVAAGLADAIPDHIKACRPPYSFERLQPSDVLTALHGAGWSFGSDRMGQLLISKGADHLTIRPGVQVASGCITEADVRYLDGYVAVVTGDEVHE